MEKLERERDEAREELATVTAQRDRLIEAIKEHKATMQHRQEFHDSKLYEALQSLTTNAEVWDADPKAPPRQ
jgi:uncharacterized coiled-coil DUF342 family protein